LGEAKAVDPVAEPLEALQDAGIAVRFFHGTDIPQCSFSRLAEVLGQQVARRLVASLVDSGIGDLLDDDSAVALSDMAFDSKCDELFEPDHQPAKKTRKFPHLPPRG
jgi:hypothetical protein